LADEIQRPHARNDELTERLKRAHEKTKRAGAMVGMLRYPWSRLMAAVRLAEAVVFEHEYLRGLHHDLTPEEKLAHVREGEYALDDYLKERG
jgi:hypothetical protein